MRTQLSRPAAHRAWPLPARWVLSAVAYPAGGLLAITIAGSVDDPRSAVAGGALAGASIGVGQWVALRPFVRGGGRLRYRWIGGTSIAMAAGLGFGAAAVGYRTGTADLLAMGSITGAVLGPAQAAVLYTAGGATRWRAAIWAMTVPLLWALGWFVTASAGVDVDRQYAVFGITGALASSVLGAPVLTLVLADRPRS